MKLIYAYLVQPIKFKVNDKWITFDEDTLIRIDLKSSTGFIDAYTVQLDRSDYSLIH